MSSSLDTNDEEGKQNSLVFEEQCVICLSKKLWQPSMVMPCFHSFCTGCISIWLERSSKCPLCNRVVDRIIYDIQSETQYKQVTLPSINDDITASHLVDLDMNIPHHPFRQRVYYTPLSCVKDVKNVHRFAAKRINDEERIREWVVRDLEAILRTYRVQILTEYVMSLIAKKDIQKECDEFVTLLREYLDNLTEHFVEELTLFSSSNLSMKGYDRSVKYEEENRTLQQVRIQSKLKRKKSQHEIVVIDDDDDNSDITTLDGMSEDRKGKTVMNQMQETNVSQIGEQSTIEVIPDDDATQDDDDLTFCSERKKRKMN